MFSDRWWILKAAATLGLLALLFNYSRDSILRREPDVERTALDWRPFRDHVFHLAAKKVLSADATGFEIGTKVGSMRIQTATPPPVGVYVRVNARPVGPRTLEPVALEVLTGYDWKRPLNYVVSVVTLLAYLWLIRKRFRWTPETGVFRSRY